MTVVLVTATRRAVFAEHAGHFRAALLEAAPDAGPHTLWHGDADGGDRIAARIARQFGWTVRGIPANWAAACRDTCKPGHRQRGGDYCPAVGNYRNQQLVDTVAPHLPDVVCVAVSIPGVSRGTYDCARRAQAAGITVLERSLTATVGAS